MRDLRWGRIAVALVLTLALQQVLMIHAVRVLYLPFDKWVHASSFVLVTLLFAWALGVRMVCIAALMLGLGALDEVTQIFLPGRTASVGDWLADALGVGLAVAGLWVWWRLKRPKPRLRPP
nr:VanZ family protein [Azoarcus sp. L1K30]